VADRFVPLRKATQTAVTTGPGVTPPALRQAAFAGSPPDELCTLVEKIRAHASKVTDEDFARLRDRYSEDQLFEIVVAAAVGAADVRLQAGLRALEEA
jgi:hypothetical protein